MSIVPFRTIVFTNAQVLSPKGAIGSSLRITGGRITSLNSPPEPGDGIIDIKGAWVIPGLINAHDHLDLNNFRRLKWRRRYRNVRDWIEDFQPRFKTDPALSAPMSVPLEIRYFAGGIKNLLSGATTVCHHNPMHPVLFRDFPVRIVTRFKCSHSLLIDGDKAKRECRRTPHDWPWIIHAAEGTDADARRELEQLDRWGCLGENTVLVHGVGLAAEDRRLLLSRGSSLIWCPSSNLYLLGTTATVSDLASVGRVALGTDSRLSGERDLLAEMHCASLTGQVDNRSIFRMVTDSAASILRLPRTGRLCAGASADLLVLAARSSDPFEDIIHSSRSSLQLVLLNGRAQIGDPDMEEVFLGTGVPAEDVRLDGRTKKMAKALVEELRRHGLREPGLEF